MKGRVLITKQSEKWHMRKTMDYTMEGSFLWYCGALVARTGGGLEDGLRKV